MRLFKGILCVAAIFVGSAQAETPAETVAIGKTVPVKAAPIAKASQSRDGGTLPMYRGAGKMAKITAKVRVVSVPSDKKYTVRETDKVRRINPRLIGANKLSMQQINRYAYRNSSVSAPGVPVKKAGGDPAEKTDNP
jgi:hypothetical protein